MAKKKVPVHICQNFTSISCPFKHRSIPTIQWQLEPFLHICEIIEEMCSFILCADLYEACGRHKAVCRIWTGLRGSVLSSPAYSAENSAATRGQVFSACSPDTPRSHYASYSACRLFTLPLSRKWTTWTTDKRGLFIWRIFSQISHDGSYFPDFKPYLKRQWQQEHVFLLQCYGIRIGMDQSQ
jgi:hypothetical protein